MAKSCCRLGEVRERESLRSLRRRRRRRWSPASMAVSCAIEAIERRLFLSAYTPSAVTYFGTNPNGSNPLTTLVADAKGDLFGTTEYGGAANTGTIFEIARGSSALTTLASFDNSKAGFSDAGLIIDSAGDLFDKAYKDSSASCYDTLYELPAGSNSLTVLESFTSNSNGTAIQSGRSRLRTWSFVLVYLVAACTTLANRASVEGIVGTLACKRYNRDRPV